MSNKLKFKIKPGLELDKRTYLNGAVFETTCKCGEKLRCDFGDEYLSHPIVGEKEDFTIWCDECEDDIEIGTTKIQMTLTITEKTKG